MMGISYAFGANVPEFCTPPEQFAELKAQLQLTSDAMARIEPDMERLARIAEEKAKPHAAPPFQCAKGVKDALLAAGILTDQERKNPLPGKKIGKLLSSTHKFKRLANGPNGLPVGCKTLYDLPPGAIAVYDSGYHPKDGHTEIRTFSGFASDFKSNTPITGVAGGRVGNKHKFLEAWVPISDNAEQGQGNT